MFEEFNSIITRNTSSKCSDHDLFFQYYKLMLDLSHQQRFNVKMQQKCKRTGWPIDIDLRAFSGKSLFKGQRGFYGNQNLKRMAVYFFLQEEMCYNLMSGKEEPLAI